MLDIYLWFQYPTGGANEIIGEAQDAKIRSEENCKPIKIKQFGFEIENATTIGSASGGASSGRCVLKPFNISKVTDSCSPDFFTACAVGGHYGKAVILLRKDAKPYIRYTFSMCFVTKVNWSGSEGDDTPNESIDFAYGALNIMYYPQSTSGNMKPQPKIAVFNQVNNTLSDIVTDAS